MWENTHFLGQVLKKYEYSTVYWCSNFLVLLIELFSFVARVHVSYNYSIAAATRRLWLLTSFTVSFCSFDDMSFIFYVLIWANLQD